MLIAKGKVENMKRKTRTKKLILCSLFSSLIAIGAFIKVPIPVVPFTLQFLFTNLAGLLLGRKLGSASVGLYVTLGLVGLPIFTGEGGIGYILQPTFGYLRGLILYCFILAVPGDILICFVSSILAKRLYPIIKGEV